MNHTDTINRMYNTLHKKLMKICMQQDPPSRIGDLKHEEFVRASKEIALDFVWVHTGVVNITSDDKRVCEISKQLMAYFHIKLDADNAVVSAQEDFSKLIQSQLNPQFL